MKIYTNYEIIDETTDMTIFIQLSVRISLVILKTLKALKIRTALKADKFEPPEPNDI